MPLALIVLDAKATRHSRNALLGALDTAADLDDVEIRLAAGETQLEQHIAESAAAGRRPVVAVSCTTPRLDRVRELMTRFGHRTQYHSVQPSRTQSHCVQSGRSGTPPYESGRSNAPSYGEALWIAGGPHPTADPEGTLALGFDVAVLGEGEATLLDLLRTLDNVRRSLTPSPNVGRSLTPSPNVRRSLTPSCNTGRSETPSYDVDNLSTVAGTAYRDAAGVVQRTARREPIDLDAFPPFPLRRRRMVGPIEITRGCPFACGFCQTSHLLGVRPRHRSIETIVRYAAAIRERAHCDLRVITPNAFSYGSADGRTLNLPALESLLSALRRTLRDDGRLFFGTFPSEVRPEHVTDETLALLKRFANNDYLIIGAQSGSERMLAHCRRGHGVAEVFAATARILAAGLQPHVDFLFGLPGETEADLDETVRVVRELAAMGALIHAHTFMPLPQTPFAAAPPGRITGRLRAFIRQMIASGRMYGIWREQELAGQRMAK